MSSVDNSIFFLHIATCHYMTGLILIIQLIHYPSFSFIEKTKFVDFHIKHTKALGLLAGPGMVIELFTSLWLLQLNSAGFYFNSILVFILWGVTFFISVPQHNRLAKGFDENAWRILVRTNWIRTILWVGRSMGFLIYQIFFFGNAVS